MPSWWCPRGEAEVRGDRDYLSFLELAHLPWAEALTPLPPHVHIPPQYQKFSLI